MVVEAEEAEDRSTLGTHQEAAVEAGIQVLAAEAGTQAAVDRARRDPAAAAAAGRMDREEPVGNS